MRISSFVPANCDGPFQRTTQLAHLARLPERNRRDARPDFVPNHFFAILREFHVDGQLVSIPVQGTIGVGVEIASGRTGIVAENSTEAFRGLVPPVQCDKKHLPSGPPYMFPVTSVVKMQASRS